MASLPRLLVVVLTMAASCQALNKLKVLHSWESIDYFWPKQPTDISREVMIHLGLFTPGNSIPFDVDWWNGRIFVTTPRITPGIPATLSTVSPYGDEMNPVLHPYPNWSWHRPGECNGFTSVFRIQVDECGNLWAVDTGNINHMNGTKYICPKQIFAFNLDTDKLVLRHVFPSGVVKEDAVLTTIVVDIVGNIAKTSCRGAFAYIADATNYGLIVYDAHRDLSWRIQANNFHPIPYFGHFDILGSEFDSMDGLIGLALSPKKWENPRTLYYHSFGSNTEGYVATSILRNELLFSVNGTMSSSTMKEFKTYPFTRIAQASTQAMDSNGILYFSELTKATLNSWKSTKPYGGSEIIDIEKDVDKLQFLSGIKVIMRNGGQEEVLLLTNRLQKKFDGSMNNKVINFRIMKALASDLVDECGRLWILDTGRINTETHHPVQICTPQFLMFHLATDKLETRYRFPSTVLKPDSHLTAFVVDVRSTARNCTTSFAYIADAVTYGLIVYDNRRSRSWRVEMANFHPLPAFGSFRVVGSEYNAMEGVNALALSPQASSDHRLLYYHSWSSNTENTVSTEYLKKEALFDKGPPSTETKEQFQTFTNTRKGQATVMEMSKAGIMFYGNLNVSGVTCWHYRDDFCQHNFIDVETDTSELRFVSGIKTVIRLDGTEEVWVLSNNYPKYKLRTFDTRDINFRLMAASVQSMVTGNTCATGGSP